jgi:hypothetical protein
MGWSVAKKRRTLVFVKRALRCPAGIMIVLLAALLVSGTQAWAQEHELRLNPDTGEWELLPKLGEPAADLVPLPEEPVRPTPRVERDPFAYRGDAPGRRDLENLYIRQPLEQPDPTGSERPAENSGQPTPP